MTAIYNGPSKRKYAVADLSEGLCPEPYHIEMKTDAWIGVPDNPRQRDTAVRALKAHHLRSPSPTHSQVAMAILTDGTKRRFKLDAHTRAHLWNTDQIPRPDKVMVTVYPCRDIDEVKRLYDHFDNHKASKSASDRLIGALNEHGLRPTSHLLCVGRGTEALRLAYMVRIGAGNDAAFDINAEVGYWLPELKILDALGANWKKFNSGIFAGALIILRKYPDAATVFLKAVLENEGCKDGKRYDGVYGMTLVRAAKVHATKQRIFGVLGLNYTGKTIACFEAWRKGRMFTGSVQYMQPGPYFSPDARTERPKSADRQRPAEHTDTVSPPC